MWLLYYYLRTRIACLRRHKSFRVTSYYVGWQMYNNYQGADKKSRLQVIRELNKLCKYWKGFPDTYFRFAMFKKDFGGFDRMVSYIPQCSYGRFSTNREPWYQILINDKILCHDLLCEYGVPTTERFFSYSYHYFRSNGRVISDAEVDEILSGITDPRIFVKRNKCGEGSGVTVAYRRDDGFYTPNGVRLSAATIRQRHYDDEYLFEKQITPDPRIAKFNPDSVNTFRVLTYNDKVVSGALRMGRKGSFVDNAAKGGVVVNIDVATGRLSDYGLREYDVTKYYEHPDTHVPFKGEVVPDWDKVVELVEKTCQLLPYYSSVGFDIVCTTDGPIVLEINTGTGVYASQMGRDWGIADVFLKQ